MSKKLQFALTTMWILVSRGYDAYCTNQLTPDLSKEANPLVTVVGVSSWTTLLTILGVLTIYVVYCYYVSVFRPMDLFPKEKGYTFGQFMAYTYLGRKDNWSAMICKLPKDLNRFNQWMGHVLTQGLVFAGIVSTGMWMLINHTDFYRKMHSAALIYGILITGCLVIIYRWNKTMFRKYLTDTLETRSNH